MKPGDHPDFFRLPPPAGRSRESGIVLDREGRFWHHGELVTHPGMARAFASWVSRHPDDGRYVLNNGYDWSYLTVEDTAFFVESLHLASESASASGTPTPTLVLSDGSREPFAADHAVIEPDGVLSVCVKGGTERARFTREAQLALSPLLAEDENGQLFLEFAGGAQALPLRSRKA